MTLQTLSQIESLIYRAKFYNEFLEEKLQASLDPIFKFPGTVPGAFYPEIKHLLFQISGIDKSAGFGYFLYGRMQENPYPFCEDVLKTATFTERYYNLNDKVLKAYVRSYLINHNTNPKIILEYDRIIPEGHGVHFFDTLRKIKSKMLEPGLHVDADMYTTLYHVIDQDAFPMTQKKACCIISYLNIERMFPGLTGKATALLNLKSLDENKMIVLLHLLKSAHLLKPGLLGKRLMETVDELVDFWGEEEFSDRFTASRPYLTSVLQELDPYSARLESR